MKKLRNIFDLSKLFSGTDIEYDTKVDFTKVQVDTEGLVTKTNLLDEAMNRAIDDRSYEIIQESMRVLVLGEDSVTQTNSLSSRFCPIELRDAAKLCKKNSYDVSYLPFNIEDYQEAYILYRSFNSSSGGFRMKELDTSQIIDKLSDFDYYIGLPTLNDSAIYRAFSTILAEKIKEERDARVD